MTECAKEYIPGNPRNDLNLNTFKTQPCPVGVKGNHNLKQCEFYHNDHDKRRSPVDNEYYCDLCPVLETCKLKDCKFAHSKIEQMYHSLRYRSKYCKSYPNDTHNCEYGYFCSFIHFEQEATIPTFSKYQDKTDPFCLFSLKTTWCPITHGHDRGACFYAHNVQDFRRSPLHYKLEPVDCSRWNKSENVQLYEDGGCPNQLNCGKCHGWKELEYHIEHYKLCCTNSDNCKKQDCAHNMQIQEKESRIQLRYQQLSQEKMNHRQQKQFHYQVGQPLNIFTSFVIQEYNLDQNYYHRNKDNNNSNNNNNNNQHKKHYKQKQRPQNNDYYAMDNKNNNNHNNNNNNNSNNNNQRYSKTSSVVSSNHSKFQSRDNSQDSTQVNSQTNTYNSQRNQNFQDTSFFPVYNAQQQHQSDSEGQNPKKKKQMVFKGDNQFVPSSFDFTLDLNQISLGDNKSKNVNENKGEKIRTCPPSPGIANNLNTQNNIMDQNSKTFQQTFIRDNLQNVINQAMQTYTVNQIKNFNKTDLDQFDISSKEKEQFMITLKSIQQEHDEDNDLIKMTSNQTNDNDQDNNSFGGNSQGHGLNLDLSQGFQATCVRKKVSQISQFDQNTNNNFQSQQQNYYQTKFSNQQFQ